MGIFAIKRNYKQFFAGEHWFPWKNGYHFVNGPISTPINAFLKKASPQNLYAACFFNSPTRINRFWGYKSFEKVCDHNERLMGVENATGFRFALLICSFIIFQLWGLVSSPPTQYWKAVVRYTMLTANCMAILLSSSFGQPNCPRMAWDFPSNAFTGTVVKQQAACHTIMQPARGHTYRS